MEENSKQPRIHKLANPLKDSTVATFFAVVNPGFETPCRREIEKYLQATRLEEVNGGIQFDSTWGAVRRGQPRLRIASRVLVRVDQFGARDFQKLFRKVSNLPWEEWLKPKVGLSVRAASHTSRLRIKSGIEESVVDAFKKSFKAPPPRPTQEVMCLVRVEDDICTISLDLSGDLLHKRGSHTDVGAAPLRETWAASIVDRVFEIAATDENTRASLLQKWQWIEPMAGTAVFLREGLSLRNEKPAKQEESAVPARPFAIDTCFKFEVEDETAALPTDATVRVVAKSAVTGGTNEETRLAPQDFLKYLAAAVLVDSDEKQLERGRKALGETDLPTVFVTAAKQDRSVATDLPRVVFVNPPWGQRLKTADATDTPEGQTRLMAKIESDWQPTVVAIVFPRIAGSAPKIPKGWTEHLPLDFRAGGIPVKARFFTVAARSVRK